MRIGHFVSLATALRGFERVVSGHIQAPLKSLELLRDAGHEPHLITNSHGDERTTPFCMPDGVPTHYVADPRGRADSLGGKVPGGLNPLLLARQVKEIRTITKRTDLDVLHFFGHTRTAMLAGGIAASRLGIPVVASICTPGMASDPGWFTRSLLNQVDGLAVPTETSKKAFQDVGITTRVIRHGPVKDLTEGLNRDEQRSRNRVLFWRDPRRRNGADVCVEVFDRLAPLYPELSFDIAIRPAFDQVKGIDELAAKHSNVNVFRAPYPDGVSLEALIAGSLCAVMPFRELSLDPQMAVLETLAAGVPVIATDIHSMSEFVVPGRTGHLVPVDDVEATAAAVTKCIDDRVECARMGERARLHMQDWNWDSWVDDIVSWYKSAGV